MNDATPYSGAELDDPKVAGFIPPRAFATIQALRKLSTRLPDRDDFQAILESFPCDYYGLQGDIADQLAGFVHKTRPLSYESVVEALSKELAQFPTAKKYALAAVAATAEQRPTQDVVLRAFAKRLNIRMNDILCGMKPDHDDSITGFNEAWNVTTGLIDDILGVKGAATPAPTATLQENTAHHAQPGAADQKVAANAASGTGVGSASLSPVAPAPTAYKERLQDILDEQVKNPILELPDAPTAGEVTEEEIWAVLRGSPTLDAKRVMSLLREKGLVKA